MGALGAAISGLQSSQRWLDVISNNVSNSNSVAFKLSRVTFSDIISQGIGSASGANNTANLGGINPVQLGLGVNVSSIQTIFNQGAMQTTGNVTDVAINGKGFLTVEKGNETLFTRAGNLTFDNNGNLVTSDGGLVQGWQMRVNKTNDLPAPPGTTRLSTVNNVLDTTDVSQIGRINIPKDLVLDPKATSVNLVPSIRDQGVIVKGNLDEATPTNIAAQTALTTAGLIVGAAGVIKTEGNVAVDTMSALVPDPFTTPGVIPDHTTTTTVYDSVGDPHNITIWYFQVGDTADPATPQPPQWAWYAFDTTFKAGSTWYTGTPSSFNVLGGTGIDSQNYFQGVNVPAGTVANGPNGFITFNTDGSLQTNGGQTNGAGIIQENPVLYIPEQFNVTNPVATQVLPSGGLDSFNFTINFGTPNVYTNAGGAFAGVMFTDPIQPGGNGLRDGLTGDYGSGTTILVGGVPTYQPNSTAAVIFQDGYPDGQLLGLSFDQTGTINATFTNGQTIGIATLAIADIGNPEGLAKIGGSYYKTTANSGYVRYDVAGSNGYGTIQGGTLESSNVDLTVELTNMILAQRMFESNARVVTAADRVLDTLVNLGR